MLAVRGPSSPLRSRAIRADDTTARHQVAHHLHQRLSIDWYERLHPFYQLCSLTLREQTPRACELVFSRWPSTRMDESYHHLVYTWQLKLWVCTLLMSGISAVLILLCAASSFTRALYLPELTHVSATPHARKRVPCVSVAHLSVVV